MQPYTLKDTVLYVDQISMAYGDNLVLKDITFEEKDVVRPNVNATGQFVAIVGRSGRGKSTLFKCLTGLVKPTSGRVLIGDCLGNNNALVVDEGNVGFVDQKYTLFRHKTVNTTLMYALRKTKLSKVEKQEKIKEYLIRWGLIQEIHKYPNELSGGQRQRVAIIEQIFSSGHFLILDEPFSGLDVYAINEVKNAFKLIQEDNEYNTVLFSTHDINLAVELADSIYVIGHVNPENTYSGIVSHYDLKQLGLAWEPFSKQHIDLVDQIKKDMMNS